MDLVAVGGAVVTCLGIVIGATWWMSALYIQVKQLNSRLSLLARWLTIELGGVDEAGNYMTGTQNKRRDDVSIRVSEAEQRLDDHEERIGNLEE